MDSFDKFADIMRLLVSENGCPWDSVQTHESLKPCMLEEAYEVIDAIDKGDRDNLKEELGDVLLQAVIHSVIAEKNGEFTLEDVINGISDKMIYRHPHIFGNEKAENAEGLILKWEDIKKREKGYQTKTDEMKNVAKAMPALGRGQKIIKKSMTGQDKNIDPVIDLAIEDLKILKNAENGNDFQMDRVIGRILTAVLKISNFFQINAEFSLTNALETYITKFEDYENTLDFSKRTDEDTGPENEDVFCKITKEL
ncbi:MAG: MazG family protein [Firmicutes bacterium]|nr:MazG family protein [Bacillota bacterium]